MKIEMEASLDASKIEVESDEPTMSMLLGAEAGVQIKKEPFGSMHVDGESKTPYSDATKVRIVSARTCVLFEPRRIFAC